jgi:hypothetical protein
VQGYFFGRPQPIAVYAAIVNGEDVVDGGDTTAKRRKKRSAA